MTAALPVHSRLHHQMSAEAEGGQQPALGRRAGDSRRQSRKLGNVRGTEPASGRRERHSVLQSATGSFRPLSPAAAAAKGCGTPCGGTHTHIFSQVKPQTPGPLTLAILRSLGVGRRGACVRAKYRCVYADISGPKYKDICVCMLPEAPKNAQMPPPSTLASSEFGMLGSSPISMPGRRPRLNACFSILDTYPMPEVSTSRP